MTITTAYTKNLTVPAQGVADGVTAAFVGGSGWVVVMTGGE